MSPEELLRCTLETGSMTPAELEAGWQAYIQDSTRTIDGISPVYPSLEAKYIIAFIGEGPDAQAVKENMPFSRVILDELRFWCREAGLEFDEHVYLDNIIDSPHPIGIEPTEAYLRMRGQIITERVRRYWLGDPTIVVLLGDLALSTFLPSCTGILKHRGSVHEQSNVPIIPMLHPSAVLKQTKWRRRCVFDMQRVARIIQLKKTFNFPRRVRTVRVSEYRDMCVSKDMYDVVRSLERDILPDSQAVLAIDIETSPKDGRISCVGFSCTFSSDSLVFEWPVDADQGEDAREVRKVVRTVCESPCQKILHNGLYDLWWLRKYANIEVRNYVWDTMCMAHAWYPADNLSLDYLTSICPNTIDVAYYKQEGKDIYTQGMPTTDADWKQLMEYCGKDVLCTVSIWSWLERELHKREGGLQFYKDNYQAKFEPMLDMMLQGVRIDEDARLSAKQLFMDEAQQARDELMLYNDLEPMFRLTTKRDRAVFDAFNSVNLTGDTPETRRLFERMHETYPFDDIQKSIAVISQKAVSTQKLRTLLYDKMGLPEQYERRANGEMTPTVGNLTLRKLLLEYGHERPEVAAVIKLALQHTRARKLATFASESIVDDDGRMRFSLSFLPETGRFSSSRNPAGTGLNSQNIPRDKRLRRMVLPDEGQVLLKFDMSQVEARICFVLTRDSELVRLANLRSTEYDQHSENAVLLGLAPDIKNVPKEARQIAKAAVHGAQRNMQAQTLLDTLLKMADLEHWETLELPTLEACERMLAVYHARYPAIKDVFFAETEELLRHNRYLENSFGRRWTLQYDTIDDRVLRRAYSFRLQSEAADHMNQYGFLPLYQQAKKMGGRLMLHEHDELVFSVSPDYAHPLAIVSQEFVERECQLAGNSYYVPIEFGLGSSWAYEHEWKELPTPAEMISCAHALLTKRIK